MPERPEPGSPEPLIALILIFHWHVPATIFPQSESRSLETPTYINVTAAPSEADWNSLESDRTPTYTSNVTTEPISGRVFERLLEYSLTDTLGVVETSDSEILVAF